MRFAAYRRVSTRRQTEGFSLKDQLERLTTLAENSGADVEDFCDPGLSGEMLDERPKLVELLSRLHEFDAVLVVDDSRLARNELVAATIREKLRQANTRLITLSGEVDLNDPTDRFTSGVIALANQLEQGLRTQKMIDGLRSTASGGFWTGGVPPYGYQIIDGPDGSRHRKLDIRDSEAAVLRLACDLIVNKGHTTYSATAYLNAHGYRTRGRKKHGQQVPVLWRHSNLCHQLRKRHLTGIWLFKQGGKPIEVEIPAIFTTEEWNQLQASINGRPRPQRKSRRYPLTGRGRVHLRCNCGGNYSGKTDSSKKGRSYYECSRNHHAFGDERCVHRPRIMRALDLEAAVLEQVKVVLTDEDYLIQLARVHLAEQLAKAPSARSDRRSIETRIANLNEEKKNIIRALAGQDELDTLGEALAEANHDIATLSTELDEIKRRADLHIDAVTVEKQLEQLAATARSRLANASTEMMAALYDLLDLDLVRTGSNRFEGTGVIPIPEDGGDVWEDGPNGGDKRAAGPNGGEVWLERPQHS